MPRHAVARRLHARLPSALLVSVVLGLGFPADGGAREELAASFPQQLVGTWTRNVTELGRLSYTDGRWRIRIRRGGALEAYLPGGKIPDFRSRVTVAGAGRLSIHELPICGTRGLYRWKVVGRLLTLKSLRDPQCPPRVALFSGVWKRT